MKKLTKAEIAVKVDKLDDDKIDKYAKILKINVSSLSKAQIKQAVTDAVDAGLQSGMVVQHNENTFIPMEGQEFVFYNQIVFG